MVVHDATSDCAVVVVVGKKNITFPRSRSRRISFLNCFFVFVCVAVDI